MDDNLPQPLVPPNPVSHPTNPSHIPAAPAPPPLDPPIPPQPLSRPLSSPSTPNIHPPSVTPESPATQPPGSHPPLVSNKISGKSNKKLVIGLAGILILISALTAGVFMIKNRQELRKQAAGAGYCDGLCAGQTQNCDGCHSNAGPAKMVHFVCDGITPSDQGCGYNNGEEVWSGVAINRQFLDRDCGMQQIDAATAPPGESDRIEGSASIIYDQPCEEPEPTDAPTPTNTPIPTPTPTPPGRPDYCVSAAINPTALPPGQSTTFSSISNTSVNYFTYSLYNRDHLVNGIPQSICVTQGGDGTWQGDCPAGTHALIFSDPNSSLHINGSRTVNYENIFVADQNHGGQIVSRIQMNAYFMLQGGLTSLADPDCVAYVASQIIPTATPIPTPTPTIPGSPTATPVPTATPTQPPDNIVAQCTAIFAQKQNQNGVWQNINPTTQAKPGDTIRFVVYGSTNQGGFTKAAFFVNSSNPVEVTTPTTVNNIPGFVLNHTVTAGTLTVKAVMYHAGGGWVD